MPTPGLMHRCVAVTEIQQVENRCPIVSLGNEVSVDVMNHAWERKFVYCSVDTLLALRLKTKGSHYFIREFDATNFSERNKIQTE